MRSTRQQARFAGLLYVLMIVLGLPGLIIIPGRLIVDGNAAATADHIRAAATLFRLGMASELVYQVLFAFLGLALYRLFEAVDKRVAVQMVALVLLSIPIVFLGVVNELVALILVSGPRYLATFTQPQLDSLAYLFLQLRGEGLGVVQVFWGLWLVPFGLLVMRSGFLPKVLGALLVIAALGYLMRVARSLFPEPYTAPLDSLSSVLTLGEPPIILWLLIVGAKGEPAGVAASP